MQTIALPLFPGSKIITYSMLSSALQKDYVDEKFDLIKKIERALKAYADETQGKMRRREYLQQLNGYSLQISCLNPAWMAFSSAVFEVVAVPAKVSLTSSAERLFAIFEQTQQQLLEGYYEYN